MTVHLGGQRADQFGYLWPGQAEGRSKMALRQRRFRAVAGVEECLHDRLLGRRRHTMRALARSPERTEFAEMSTGVNRASLATVAGLGFQPSFEEREPGRQPEPPRSEPGGHR
jgi:hypothetical protein